MRNLLKNKWLWGGLAVYAASLVVLLQGGNFGVEEAIFGFLIFGLFFSTAAWLATRRARPLEFSIAPERTEMIFLAVYVAFVFLYLISGSALVDSWLPAAWLDSARFVFVWKILKKLLVFVIVPFVLFGRLFGYRARDFGFRKEAPTEFFKSHLPAALVLGGLVLLLNYFIGNGAKPLREGAFSGGQLIVAVPLFFAVLLIEVGLVEEFFYRVVVQSRAAAFFESETAGVVVAGLVFAVSHAPGMILRQAGAIDGLGAAPPAWEAVAYTIAVISLFSVMFAVLWIRTRNLFLLMFVHALADLLPNLADFVKTWNP